MSKSERISQISIVLIAVSALVISVWQGYISQKHNRLTVRPYLNFSVSTTSSSDDQQFFLKLTNQGYGPAIIKKFEIFVDGIPQEHWNAALRKLEIEDKMRHASNFDVDDVFAPGKEQRLLTLSNYFGEDRMKIKITYQSIYEEEFVKEEEF